MPSYRARIAVTLRTSILDPQGKAVQHAAAGLGLNGVQEVRIGKLADVTLDAASPEDARRLAERFGQQLLANPVMEDFAVETVDAC